MGRTAKNRNKGGEGDTFFGFELPGITFQREFREKIFSGEILSGKFLPEDPKTIIEKNEIVELAKKLANLKAIKWFGCKVCLEYFFRVCDSAYGISNSEKLDKDKSKFFVDEYIKHDEYTKTLVEKRYGPQLTKAVTTDPTLESDTHSEEKEVKTITQENPIINKDTSKHSKVRLTDNPLITLQEGLKQDATEELPLPDKKLSKIKLTEDQLKTLREESEYSARTYVVKRTALAHQRSTGKPPNQQKTKPIPIPETKQKGGKFRRRKSSKKKTKRRCK
jgi:hypothetical protein